VSIVRYLLSGVCHQMASHCLYFGGQPLPICARCSGTYVGAMLGMLCMAALGERRRSGLPRFSHTAPLLALVAIWAFDSANSTLHDWGLGAAYTPTNTLRLITGTGMGLAVASVLYPAANLALLGDAQAGRVLEPAWHVAAIMSVGGAFVGLTVLWPGAPRVLALAVHIAAVAAVLATVNATLLSLLLQRQARATKLVQTAPWLALGLWAAILETGAMAALRSMLERFT